MFELDEPVYLILMPDESLTGSPRETAQRFFDRTREYWLGWVRRLGIPFEYQHEVRHRAPPACAARTSCDYDVLPPLCAAAAGRRRRHAVLLLVAAAALRCALRRLTFSPRPHRSFAPPLR